MLNSSITDYRLSHSYIFIQFILKKQDQYKHRANIGEQRNNKASHILAQLLAQAERSRSGRKVSLRRDGLSLMRAPFA